MPMPTPRGRSAWSTSRIASRAATMARASGPIALETRQNRIADQLVDIAARARDRTDDDRHRPVEKLHHSLRFIRLRKRCEVANIRVQNGTARSARRDGAAGATESCTASRCRAREQPFERARNSATSAARLSIFLCASITKRVIPSISAIRITLGTPAAASPARQSSALR